MKAAFRVSRGGAGVRLDKLMVEAAPSWTRGAVQRAIRNGDIRVDGKRVAPSCRVSAGQRIDYPLQQKAAAPLKPEPIPLQIVYEEADALIVNKPPGMTTHPAPSSETGTLANALLAHYPGHRACGRPDAPGIVHRLDRGTSGLLAAAKTTRGYEALRPQFADHSTERLYCALVYGSPRTKVLSMRRSDAVYEIGRASRWGGYIRAAPRPISALRSGFGIKAPSSPF